MNLFKRNKRQTSNMAFRPDYRLLHSLVTMVMVLSSPVIGGGGYTGAPAGDFDYYLLQLFWSPQFCCGNHGYCTEENRDILVLHGLWPNYNQSRTDHKYNWPQYCDKFSNCYSKSGGDSYDNGSGYCHLNRSAITSTEKYELEEFAPGYYSKRFGDHEWIKHGSCSGLTIPSYLDTALSAEENLVSEIGRDFFQSYLGRNVSVATIRSELPDGVIVSSTGKGHLSFITTCWSKTQQNTLGERITCPDSIENSFQTKKSIVLVTSGNDSCYGSSRSSSMQVSDRSSYSTTLPLLAIILSWLVWTQRRRRLLVVSGRNVGSIPSESCATHQGGFFA